MVFIAQNWQVQDKGTFDVHLGNGKHAVYGPGVLCFQEKGYKLNDVPGVVHIDDNFHGCSGEAQTKQKLSGYWFKPTKVNLCDQGIICTTKDAETGKTGTVWLRWANRRVGLIVPSMIAVHLELVFLTTKRERA